MGTMRRNTQFFKKVIAADDAAVVQDETAPAPGVTAPAADPDHVNPSPLQPPAGEGHGEGNQTAGRVVGGIDIRQVLGERWSQKLEDEIVRRLEIMKKSMKAVAMVVGGSSEIKVHLQPYGYSMDMDKNIFSIGVWEILQQSDDELRFLPVHEGGHKDISRVADMWFFEQETRRLLLNVLEDPRVNNYERYRFMGAGEFFRAGYDAFYPRDRRDPYDSYEDLPHEQFGYALIHKWAHGEDNPRVVDKAVQDAVAEAWEHAQRVFGMHPHGRVFYSEERAWLVDECMALIAGRHEQGMLTHKDWREEIDYFFREGMSSDRAFDEKADILLEDLGRLYEEAYGRRISDVYLVQRDVAEKTKKALAVRQAAYIRENIYPIYERLLQQSMKIVSEMIEGQGSGEESEAGSGRPKVIPKELLSEEARRRIESRARKLADKYEGKAVPRPVDQARENQARRVNDQRTREEEMPKGSTLLDRIKKNIALKRKLDASRNIYQKYYAPVSKLTAQLKGKLRNVLVPDADPDWQGHYLSGKRIDIKKYQQSEMSGVLNEKVMLKKVVPEIRDHRISLVFDHSGSMSGERKKKVMEAMAMLIEVLNSLKVKYNIIGFSSAAQQVKSFNDTLDNLTQKVALYEEINELYDHGGFTNDIEGLTLAIDEMSRDLRENNVIIVLTDGEGNCKGKHSLEELQKIARKRGISVIGIGIGEGISFVSKHYSMHIQEPDINNLPRCLAQLLAKIIIR